MSYWLTVSVVTAFTNTGTKKVFQVLASPSKMVLTAAWLLLIPLWRELHFYFAHRFLHIRCIYKYVHSLHHRDSNPEPFSGMCMHPVEHLYYFSNALVPTLFLNLSPLIFQFNFTHLVIIHHKISCTNI